MTMFRREKKNNWALINRVKYDGPCDGKRMEPGRKNGFGI